MNKKSSNLFLNTILLTITALIMRIIAIIFKVYISNEIGAEGMGLYKLIGTVYMVGVTFAMSGISTAVTRIVSEEVGKRAYNNVKTVIYKACSISFCLSIVISLILVLFSKDIAFILLKDERIIVSIKIIALSIPFIAISSCIKGYFYAVRDIFIPITSQFAEQFIKISVVVFCLTSILPKGVEYGCIALVLGTTISEIFSCIYVFIAYLLEKKENNNFTVEKRGEAGILRRLIKIALPVAGTSYISTGFRTVETMLVPIGLVKFGMSNKEAVSVLGGVMGMAFPIIMFPAVLLMSLGRILIPEISRAKALNNKERVNSLISRSLGFTSIIGIISFAVFFIFSEELSISIYNRNDIGLIFKSLSYVIPFMYIDMVMDGILNGLNEQVKSLEYQIIESLIRVSLIYVLIPSKGINGLIISMLISVLFSFILNLLRIVKVTRIDINISNWVIKPIIVAGVSVFTGNWLLSYLNSNNIALGIETTIVIVVTIAVYTILIWLFKCIKIKD